MIKIAVCGRSASGKDYVCRQLSKLTGLRYHYSTSKLAAQMVYEAHLVPPGIGVVYANSDECYSDRRNRRKFWNSVITSYNIPNKTKLYEEMLSHNDLINGVWRLDELQECLNKGMIDLVIWIERYGLLDPTIDFGPSQCDITIDNTGRLSDLDTKLLRISALLM